MEVANTPTCSSASVTADTADSSGMSLTSNERPVSRAMNTLVSSRPLAASSSPSTSSVAGRRPACPLNRRAKVVCDLASQSIEIGAQARLGLDDGEPSYQLGAGQPAPAAAFKRG